MRFKAKVLVASGGLLLSAAAASTGIASAQPDIGPIVNTTCSYPQVISALNAQDPAAAAEFTASPFAVGWLQNFLATGPAQRTVLIQQVQAQPIAAQYTGLVLQVANTCSSF
jgi:hemophore-related protein